MGRMTFERPRPLGEEDHVEGFHCGVDTVDLWVSRYALRARSLGTAVVYATFQGEKLAGLYSLSSQSLSRDETSGWIARNAPLQVPVILLGMLGVDEAYQGQGLGHDLLLDAVRRAELVAGQIGARAIVVDPADDTARSFYERYGFKAIPGSGRMFAKLR